MKKVAKKYTPVFSQNILEDTEVVYPITSRASRKEALVKEFTYDEFKRILIKSPFSLAEWASMLFMSERSLHRYAKDESGFNGLQIERIFLLEALVDLGNEMFGRDGFKTWLQSRPFSLGGDVVQSYLTTHDGIQELIDILGRMQHGISA